MAVSKEKLAELVAEKTGLSKTKASEVITAVTTSITECLSDGEEVRLVGFGTFLVSKRKATTGRNPQTGASMHIAASKVPGFKAGKGLKDKVKYS